jgi:hypothetical protein
MRMKRSGFKRKPMVKIDGPAKATIKAKKCKACRGQFFPVSAWQTHCRAEDCALAAVQAEKAKRERKEAKDRAEQNKQDRAKRIALKTIHELKKEAQHAFNAYIRARDRLAGFPCVCCGRPLDWGRLGGAVDAGHYRSTGSADHLRFREDNCHAQRSDCNRFGAGRAVDYRIGLLSRIGRDRLEALETDNAPHKWTREELISIRDEYRAKARALAKPSPDSGAQLGACAI